MTVGGEEIATVDVPLINQRFGFHLLPIGCHSLNDDPADATDETQTAAWTAENADKLVLANASWSDGEECHDGLLNNDEANVDCVCIRGTASHLGRFCLPSLLLLLLDDDLLSFIQRQQQMMGRCQ